MGERQRIEITPKMVAALSAAGGALLCGMGHYWIGGMMIVAAFILWFIDELRP